MKIKRILSVAATFVMALGLFTGCGAASTDTTTTTANNNTTAVQDTVKSTAASDSTTAQTTPSSGKKTLVVYYSASGSTKAVAPELYVKVDAASCRVKETEKIGVGGLTEQIVAVTVTGEGEILSGTVSASENPANAEAGNTETNITNTSYEKMTREKEQLLNSRMEDYLNAIAAHALEKEIDITNSYRNLGADNRTWYFKYQNTPAAYEKDIKIQYLVKINWKSE